MIRCAREVVCTLTVDLREELYRECGIQHLFYMSRHTACRLKRLADEAGVRLREDVRCGRRPAWRFAQCPGAGISWSGTCTAMGERSGREKTEAVQLCERRSPGEEIGFVCASIWRMVQEEGMRFRDAALITGDLSSYKGEIARQFSENGIPYFLDDKKSILENPMVELIRAALDTIRDFSYENVCRYLKIGLVYDREDDQEESGGFLPAPMWRR